MFAQPGIATSPPLHSLWSATTTHATLLTGSDRLAGFQLAVYQSRPQKFFFLFKFYLKTDRVDRSHARNSFGVAR